MKRKLQKMIALLALLLVPFFISSQEYGSILNESFENGIPTGWIQEKVYGNVDWIVEKGGNYPVGAYFGEKRLSFCSHATVTTNAVTRIVTPVLTDFTSLRDPILVFAHAQDKYANDFDTLKVLYRRAGMNEWALLKVYDRYIADWQIDTVSLTFLQGARDFQLAFQACDNLGRGIVLDNIELRSRPSCFTPEQIYVKDITTNSAEINWFGAWDAESFAVKVSSTFLTDVELNGSTKADIVDVELFDVRRHLVEGLSVGTKYYLYLRTNCYGEYSDWAVDSFVTANLLDIPYREDFNLPSTPNFVNRLPRWYYGASEGVVYPFVNTGSTKYLYYYSVDSTFSLNFFGQEFSNVSYELDLPAIPARAYSYAALPRVENCKIQDLMLSFWAVAYARVVPTETSNIIVGVMEDPEDISSFEAVDTIILHQQYSYEECFVSFEKYSGTGKYIALLSRFTVDNKFSLDNLVLDFRPEVMKINDFKLVIPTANSIKIDVCANVNYSKYDVVLAKKALTIDELNSSATTNVIRKTISDGDVIEGLECETEYVVYLRGVEGGKVGEWSNRKYVRTLGLVSTFPYEVESSADSILSAGGSLFHHTKKFYAKRHGYASTSMYLPKGTIMLANHYTPSSNGSNIYLGTSHSTQCVRTTKYAFEIYANTAAGARSVLVLPQIANEKDARVQFYAGSARGYTGFWTVGFMTDANDMSTFVPIDSIYVTSNENTYCFYDLDIYKEENRGKFFAICADATNWNGYICGYIDELQIVRSPECRDAANIEAITNPLDPTKVNIKWEANEATEWIVSLYDNSNCSADNLISRKTVNSPSVEFTDLLAPKYTYYYTIQPICGVENGNVSTIKSFTTVCVAYEQIPYVENFENERYATTVKHEGFSVPCMTTKQIKVGNGTNASYYPYVGKVVNVANVTTNCLVLQKSRDNSYMPTHVALPKFGKLVNELQVSFDAHAAEYGSVFRVGVMTDPYDSLTIKEVAVIRPKAINEWINYVVAFNSYIGSGEYIVFGTAKAWKTEKPLFIDNIEVDVIQECSRPEDVKINDLADTYVDLSWTNSTTIEQWGVLLAKQRLSEQELWDFGNNIISDNIYRCDTVSTNPCRITELRTNSTYWVYVRSLCGNTISEWSYPISFRTACEVKTPLELGVESFEDYGLGQSFAPDCYIVGNNGGVDKPNYVPYCFGGDAHTGRGSLLIYSTAIGTSPRNGAYAITPRMDVEDISKLRMRFWGSTGGASYATTKYAKSIVVGVVTDPTRLATFEPVDTLYFDGEVRPYEVYFSNYESDYLGGKGKYVMFLSEFSLDNRVCIDDVEFDFAPKCRVDFDIVSVTNNSLSVEVVEGDAPYQLICVDKMYGEAALNTMSAIDVQSGNTYTVTGLDADKDYYVYVRSTCDETWTEWSLPEKVHTDCNPTVAVPFYDGFEDYPGGSSGMFPGCWYADIAEGEYATLYVNTSTVDNHQGKRSVLMETKKADNQAYLVSREMDIDDLKQCIITLFAKSTTNTSFKTTPCITVGIVEDINNIRGTFIPIEKVVLSSLEWTKINLSLENYEGSGKHIAITAFWNDNKKQVRYFIDDVFVELTPTCLRPENFGLVSATDTSLTVKFDCEEAMKYEVKVGLKGFDVESNGVSTIETTEKIATVENLNDETEYDVYVRAYCSESDVSLWAYAGTYKTLEGGYVKKIPYVCDFSNPIENLDWVLVNGEQTDRWHIGLDDANEVADTNVPDSALYISYDGGASAKYFNYDAEDGLRDRSYTYAYRTISLKAGSYYISYDWKCQGLLGEKGDLIDFVKVALVPIDVAIGPGTMEVRNTKTGVKYNFDHGLGDGFIFELSESHANGHGYPNCYALHGADTWRTTAKSISVSPEQEGIYNLVFFWCNQRIGLDRDVTLPAPMIDNVSIDYESCFVPYGLDIASFTHESVNLVWQSLRKADAYKVVVSKVNVPNADDLKPEQIVFTDIVSEERVYVDKLESATAYFAYVKSVCSDEDESDWFGPLEFNTNCPPFPIDSVYNFDNLEKTYTIELEGDLTTLGSSKPSYIEVPECFVFDNSAVKKISSNKKYFPQVITNNQILGGIEFTYSRSGSNAICLKRTGYDNAGAYVVLPLSEGDKDNLYLNFWMRCVVHNTKTGKFAVNRDDASSTTYLEGILSTASRKITIGSMKDPEDHTTFKAHNVFEYPYKEGDIKETTTIADDPTGNNYWVKYTVPLKGFTGDYVVFKNEMYGDGCNNNIVYIDDIEITNRICASPNVIEIKNIKKESVVIDADLLDGVREYVLQLAKDKDFNEIILNKTVTQFPVSIDTLSANTRYFVRVKSICSDEDQSDWSAVYTFATLRGVVYDQDFTEQVICPIDWQRSGGPYSEKADYPSLVASDVLNNLVTFRYLKETDVKSWQTVEKIFDRGLFSSRHIAVTMELSQSHWLFSPILELSNEEDNYHLAFDLALTDKSSNAQPFEGFTSNVNSRFMVIVSDDGGITWKTENAVTWGTSRDEYKFSSIPVSGRSYSIDLTKYAGKPIMVAFYVYTKDIEEGDGAALHIDNIHINAYRESYLVQDVCESVDFRNENFSILSDSLQVGENHFDIWELLNNGDKDIFHKLTLDVKEMKETRLSASICESSTYSGYNFENLTKPGVYKQKLEAANGCDSVVVLDLTIIPIIRNEVYDSICQGMTYKWNGKEYNRSGVYSETFESVVTGCDSVVSLVLLVKEALRYDEYVNICYGDTFDFAGRLITETGVYEREFKTAAGCDSIVTLHATVLPDYTNMSINAVIKEGEVYNENGFIGITKPGTYELPLKTADGCDSIITLNLLVGNATDYLDVVICNGGSYQFGTRTITQSGQYIETFAEDSVVLLNATVLPDLRQTIDAYICNGESYNLNGFTNKTETGVYTLPLTSVDGCDSTITLNLMVLNGDTTEITKRITASDLPYENKELGLYYGVETKAGEYTDIIKYEAENCEEIIIHKLIVEVADAIDYVRTKDLILVPNPVNANNTLFIEAEFTVEERDGMAVEVFNSIGQRVFVDTSVASPIMIDGLTERGVYIVRVITGTGFIYQGKVIVK